MTNASTIETVSSVAGKLVSGTDESIDQQDKPIKNQNDIDE